MLRVQSALVLAHVLPTHSILHPFALLDVILAVSRNNYCHQHVHGTSLAKSYVAGPPQTAEEYLQWVRHEAQRCPRVTRKEIDPAKLAAAEAASNSRAAAASASTPSTTGRRGAAAAAGGPGKGAGSGNRGAGQGPKTLGVKRAGEGIERAGIADQDHEEGQEGTGEEAGEEVAVGGGGSLAAVRASATARAYSLLAAAPGACGCSEWARPNPKWLRVFVQVRHVAGAHVVRCLPALVLVVSALSQVVPRARGVQAKASDSSLLLCLCKCLANDVPLSRPNNPAARSTPITTCRPDPPVPGWGALRVWTLEAASGWWYAPMPHYATKSPRRPARALPTGLCAAAAGAGGHAAGARGRWVVCT